MNPYLFRAKNFRTKHRLGQNFLVDESVIKEILNEACPNDNILEIGPGAGFVTEGLLHLGAKVTAVELDNDAISLLQKKSWG